MRQLQREKRGVWVSEFVSKEERIVDGMHTGEWLVTRSDPVLVTCTLSPCGGNTYADGFGWGESYDRTLIVDALDTPITETSVLWCDVRPELDADGHLVLDEDGNPTVPWDYVVSQIALSYNFTNVALKKAEV